MREPCHLAKIAGARSSSCPADIAVVACLSYSFGPSEEIVGALYPAEEQKTIQEYQVGFLLVAVERTVEEPAADTFAVAVDSVRHTFAVAVVAAAAAFVVEALVEEYTHSY